MNQMLPCDIMASAAPTHFLSVSQMARVRSLAANDLIWSIIVELHFHWFLSLETISSLDWSDISISGSELGNALMASHLQEPLRQLRKRHEKCLGRTNGPLFCSEEGLPILASDIRDRLKNLYIQSGALADSVPCDPRFNQESLLCRRVSQYQIIHVFQVDNIRYAFTNFAAIAIFNPSKRSFRFARYQNFVRLLEVVPILPKRILVLGAGMCVLPNYLAARYPDSQIDICEIDKTVIDVAREYFSFRETDRMQMIIEDAVAYLQHNKSNYDIVLIDIPFVEELGFGGPGLRTTLLDLSEKAVGSDGLLIVNLVGEDLGKQPTVYFHNRALFPGFCELNDRNGDSGAHVYFFSRSNKFPSTEELSSKASHLPGGLDKIVGRYLVS